jgi:hypothetical protein
VGIIPYVVIIVVFVTVLAWWNYEDGLQRQLRIKGKARLDIQLA